MIPHPFVARQPLPSTASATSAGAADRTGSPPTQRIVPAVRSLGQCRRSSQGSRIRPFIGVRQSPAVAKAGSAVGVALVALVGALFLGDSLTLVQVGGLVLVGGGVLALEHGAAH